MKVKSVMMRFYIFLCTNTVYRLQFVTDVDDIFYFVTNLDAPRYKIVGIRLSAPEPSSWTTLIEQDPENVLNWAAPINR